MPVKRRKAKERVQPISAAAWALLTDQEPPLDGGSQWEVLVLSRPGDDWPDPHSELFQLWQRYHDEILTQWAVKYPGTRPTAWWRYDAPRMALGRWPGWHIDGKLAQPRRRLGGIGTPAYEVLAYAPRWPLGIPDHWIEEWQVDLYTGRARANDGNVIMQEYVGNKFAGHAVDPTDPPAYESQAAYLQRHGLLLPGEARRLNPAAYEPELVLPPEALH